MLKNESFDSNGYSFTLPKTPEDKPQTAHETATPERNMSTQKVSKYVGLGTSRVGST